MRDAAGRVGVAAARAHEEHRQPGIGRAHADLLEGARGHERGDGIGYRLEAFLGQPGGHIDHLGLGYADVDIARAVLFFEIGEDLVAEVPGQEDHAGIFVGRGAKGGGEGSSHGFLP